jgi:hypothetical protein
MEELNDLYVYLKSQFTDLEGAKIFMKKWVNELDESLPVLGCENMGSRSLSAHCSAVLEGKKEDDSGTGFCTYYLRTKYGPELYFAAWG